MDTDRLFVIGGHADEAETSMILAWPVWMVVAALVPSFALLALAGVYNAVQHWQLASAAGESA